MINHLLIVMMMMSCKCVETSLLLRRLPKLAVSKVSRDPRREIES